MMLTAAEFQEWKTQEVTEKVFKALTEYRQEVASRPLSLESQERTYKEALLREGMLAGLDALLEMDVED